MTSSPENAPGFDQPLAVLKHCHARIRKQLAILVKLPAHIRENGLDFEAQQAAFATIRYFTHGVANHLLDEEHDFMPMLSETAKGEDARLLGQLLPEFLQEHQQMEQMWGELLPQLSAIQDGVSTELDEDLILRWSALSFAHLEKEETHLATMAMRLFDNEQLQRLGHAMQVRRLVFKE